MLYREHLKGSLGNNVVAWAKSVIAPLMFISAITLKELETGVLRIERRDPAQGKVLRTWLKRHVIPAFDARILPRRCGSRVAHSCMCRTAPMKVTH